MPTLEQTFQTDLTFLHDAWDTLDQIADRHATTSHSTGRRQTTTTPLPINLGAFQLRDQLTTLTRKLIHAGGLHPTRHMTVPDLLTGILHNLPRYARLPDLPALADDTHQIADRIRLLLDPPADTKMIGRRPACTTELRADEQEIAGGWIPCPACGNEYRVKDIHQLDMLRLRVSGVKGTPAQLSRLLEPWGITIKADTIKKWGATRRHPTHRPRRHGTRLPHLGRMAGTHQTRRIRARATPWHETVTKRQKHDRTRQRTGRRRTDAR